MTFTHTALHPDALQNLLRHPANIVSLARMTHPSDLCDALSQLPAVDLVPLVMQLGPRERARLFTGFSDTRQDELLQHLPHDAVIGLIKLMPSDERADLYNRLSPHQQQQLLLQLSPDEQDNLLNLAAYPDDAVGAVTSSDYVAVNPHMTVSDALSHIRDNAPGTETIYVIYVLDPERRVLGTVSLRDLVLAATDTTITEIMRPDPVFTRAHWPRAEAAALIRRYDLLAVPVLNGGDKMIGIVTVDDAMDIEHEDDTAQLAKFGGTASLGSDNDLDIRTSSLRKMFGVRVFWLAILTLFGVITSTFVASQEAILSEVIVLAAFLAPIVDMGGNTGSQSATLVIRAMALGDLTLRWRDVWFVIKRELPLAAALGVTIAILEVVLAYFSKGVGLDVLLIVGLSMLTCTVLGGVIGALLPFVARRMGTDPATLSSPMITSVMDLVGVFIYFGFAYVFLGELLV
ncbi:magnesium transporter [Plesiomonas shigelloides]|uniref:magnesium transporter n=1 Tax=Plesiomonas shigelloides TaxID=703 RepID=UPI001C498851|nr:magnesium transporter [Plesiomonas shigelloides]